MGSLNSIFFIILPLIIINQFAAKDVLSPSDEVNSLDPNSNLLSADGFFTLGFFTITISSTNFTYLGIRYTNDDRQVWVANRDIPMISSGVLMIDEFGILKVVTKEGNNTNTTLFNVSNQVSSGIYTRAVLEVSGNFVLYENATDKNRTLWQSFDHPTDTFLHGMKLGYNLTTGQNWTLTSWLTDQIPASGAFTMRLEQYQNSPQLVIYRRGKVYWSSGAWVAERSDFQFVQNTNKNFGANLFSDASGLYVTVEIYGNNFISMTHLSSLGEIIDGGNNIVTPTFCYGSYQGNEGCAISALPNCRGKNDSFQLENGKWEGKFIQYDDNANIGLSDCMEKCWNDCNCKGFSTQDNGTGCFTWGGDAAVFILDSSKQTQCGVLISVKTPKKKTWIWIFLSATILLTTALGTYLCYIRIRRRRFKVTEKERIDDYIHQLTGSASFNYSDELEKGIKDALDVKIFSLRAILAATNNFSDENKLGHGGYGPVYKGKLFDGRQIAVKRLSNTSGQGIEEFKSELVLISQLQHTNLVRLYGCCIHQKEKMLIYEFMPNKSLDFFVFAEDKKETIDWRIRFNIIEGVAQGLLYLHKYSRMRVIHRDLKVSNILLDENMKPKIADFGIARIFQQNVTEAKTNRVVGTYGYMAPEYAMRGNFSIKSDVFSFGVLILEIVSGKMNSSFSSLEKSLNLLGYAWELWKGEMSLELKDESLGESCDLNQLLRTIHVGLLCVQEFAVDRPTMSEVISMLNNEIVDLPSPKQPGFFTGKSLVEATNYVYKKNPNSVNGLTVTMMEAR